MSALLKSRMTSFLRLLSRSSVLPQRWFADTFGGVVIVVRSAVSCA